MSGKVSAHVFDVQVTPTIGTSQYADGDQLGALFTIDTGIADDNKNLTLMSVTVIDQDDESAALDILLFDESPTIASSDNAALNVGDDEMVDKYIGHVSIAADDYVDLAANAAATKTNVNLNCRAVINGELYGIIRCGGTPTYAATDDLTLRFTFLADL